MIFKEKDGHGDSSSHDASPYNVSCVLCTLWGVGNVFKEDEFRDDERLWSVVKFVS